MQVIVKQTAETQTTYLTEKIPPMFVDHPTLDFKKQLRIADKK